MKIETERLILRRWEESDADDLYKYASDPDVGPIAGWPPHKSIDESRNIIKTVFCGAEAYAVCLKSDNRAIGAIELKLNGHTDMTERDDECELGYWLGKPFWGQGIMPEATREMLRHAFEDIGMKATPNRNVSRKRSALSINGLLKMSMFLWCTRNGQVMLMP